MSKPESTASDVREEYDFADGARGRYAARYAQGCNVVVLDPDVAAAFPTPEAVNEALRQHMQDQASRRRSGG